jgi:geranylgeranyl diphosphate synthase, type I
MGTGSAAVSVSTPALEAVRDRIDAELRGSLEDVRRDVARAHPDGARVVDELRAVIEAGGKRLRPAFCYWCYRAASGREDVRIVRVGAALELLHTLALVHDDVMDDSAVRRGAASVHARVADDLRRRGSPVDAAHAGRSVAILVGDLAAALADRMFLEAGFAPDRLLAAHRIYDDARVAMAAGQYLDVAAAAMTASGAPADVEPPEALARRIAALKTADYTVVAPLRIGAALAGATPELERALVRYGEPLGEAFQVRDDLDPAGIASDLRRRTPTVLAAKAAGRIGRAELDRLVDGDPVSAADAVLRSGAVQDAVAHVNRLVRRALSAIDSTAFAPEAAGALRELALLVAIENGHDGA